MLDNLPHTDLQIYPFINPFINYLISKMDNYYGINTIVNRNCELIISLTAMRDTFEILPIVLYSLFNQELKADRIILWLDKKNENYADLPYEISQYVKNGLDIRFIENIYPYNKTVYSMKEFNKSIIVTVNENIYYPSNWLKLLYLSYIANPKDIHINRACRINLDENKRILPYKAWDKHLNNINTSDFNNLPDGIGGILYPPNCFTNEFFRQDIFLKNAPNLDEIWIWTMALLHNKKFRVIKNSIKYFAHVDYLNFIHKVIKKILSTEIKNEYDKTIDSLMKYYGHNILNKLKIREK